MSCRQRRGLIAALAAWPLAAPAQTARVPIVTRLVTALLEHESRLAQAASAGDAAALQALLADDFEMRVASHPGAPTPRAEWLAAIARQPAPPAEIEQMAVHDHGVVAVASFVLRPVGGDRHATPLFVVDTWARDGEAWRLKVRYAAPIAASGGRRAGLVPGDAGDTTLPKKF